MSSIRLRTPTDICWGPIFICDEMKLNVAATLVSLERAGHAVSYHQNASDGWAFLSNNLAGGPLPSLLVIDMALLPGDDEHSFPDEEIDEGQTTGIYLIRKFFSELGHSKFCEASAELRKRTILYTRVREDYYVRKAQEFCRREGVIFHSKRIDDGGEFIKLLTGILRT